MALSDHRYDSSYRKRRLRRKALSALLSHLWQATTALTAAAALAFGYYQLQAHRQMQKNEDAYNIYNEMLKSSLEYPDFACVDTEEKLERIKTTVDPKSDTGEMLFGRYITYRQMVLSSMERILAAAPDQDDWVKSVHIRTQCFKPYLSSPHFTTDRYKGWKCPLRDIIAEETEIPKLRCTAAELEKEKQQAHVL